MYGRYQNVQAFLTLTLGIIVKVCTSMRTRSTMQVNFKMENIMGRARVLECRGTNMWVSGKMATNTV